MRCIYDFSDLEKSLYIHSGGQSGNTEAWAKSEYIPMRTARATLESEPHQRLRLLPRK